MADTFSSQDIKIQSTKVEIKPEHAEKEKNVYLNQVLTLRYSIVNCVSKKIHDTWQVRPFNMRMSK